MGQVLYINWLTTHTFCSDDLYRKASECEIKRPLWAGKNKAGGPEKQVILFVWPKSVILNKGCGDVM